MRHGRALRGDRSATRARELFELFTRWNFTPGLMPPKTTDARPMLGLGPRMIAIVTAQEIRENTGDTSVNGWIDRCIDEHRAAVHETRAWRPDGIRGAERRDRGSL